MAGAAVFGIGYCALVAGNGGETPSWPRSPPIVSWARSAASFLRLGLCSRRGLLPDWPRLERLRQILDQPITLRFPDETPLEDVLKAIQSTARSRMAYPVSYLDPLGLGHDDMSTSSPDSINLEHVRLGTCLRLALSQLGRLDYILTDGVLVITSEERILQTTA